MLSVRESLEEQQIQWATRKAIRLGGRYRNSPEFLKAGSGRHGYVYDLADNLFEPLSPEVRCQFMSADGDELSPDDPREGNMYAVYSSSALCCNVFHYWRRLYEEASADNRSNALTSISRACGLSTDGAKKLDFEVRHVIRESFKRAPNLDVEVKYEEAAVQAAAIEVKFCEPYGKFVPAKCGLKPGYLRHKSLWHDIPGSYEFAKRVSPEDNIDRHLHAAQLLKHVLGLKQAYGRTGFILLYLWFDVGGTTGERHRQEIGDFERIMSQDGVRFRAKTVQRVVEKLSDNIGSEHSSYVEYLRERYL